MKTIHYNNKEIAPSKVVCVGRNYVEHIEELGNEMPENMVLFNKPNSAVTSELAYFAPECRFEGELCLLVVKGEITGVGLGLDLTYADIQNRQKAKGLPWERAKAFDGSAVLSDFVPFDGRLEALRFELSRNGQLVQHEDYALMMYKPREILQEISSFMTLEDGDVIMTGTPKGVGTYNIGDRFEMRLLENDVLVLEAAWNAEERKV